VLGDATRIPLPSASVDAVMCIWVVHHLTDHQLEQVLRESLRVLVPGGRMILFDPVMNRSRWIGRTLWRLDRRSNPRTAEQLRMLLENKFKVAHWDRFAVYHEYVCGIATKA